MSKKSFNSSKETCLRDEIVFDTGEKEYTVLRLTDEIMEEITAISDDTSLSAGVSLSRQLAAFTGSDPDEFTDIDFRSKAAIIQFITEAITDPLGNRQQRRSARR